MSVEGGLVLLAVLIVFTAVAIFLIKKSRLQEFGVKLDMSQDAAKVVKQGLQVADKGLGVSERVVDRAAGAVETVSSAAVEIVAPVSKGVGDLLSAVAERVKTKQNDLNRLTAQAIALAQEVERLKGRQIDVTRTTAQLKLGLIEVAQKYTSFCREVIEANQQSAFEQESRTEYIGLRQANYRIQLGVDLEDLRFELAEGNRILVSGVRNIEILGLKDIAYEDPLDEIRLFRKQGTVRGGKAEILERDPRLQRRAAEHTRKMHQEIQSKASVQHLAEANAGFALGFLNACLNPAGYKVEESSRPLSTPLRFQELCASINRFVQSQVEGAQTQQLQIEDRVRTVESEILQIALDRGTA